MVLIISIFVLITQHFSGYDTAKISIIFLLLKRFSKFFYGDSLPPPFTATSRQGKPKTCTSVFFHRDKSFPPSRIKVLMYRDKKIRHRGHKKWHSRKGVSNLLSHSF